MSRQNLLRQKAFTILDGIDGRPTLSDICDKLIEGKSIRSDRNDYREYQEHQARKILHLHRKSKMRRGEVHLEKVHLFEIMEDGSKRHYYIKCGEMTVHEAAKHLEYWKRKLGEDFEAMKRYFDFHAGRHGRKHLQRLMPFAISKIAV